MKARKRSASGRLGKKGEKKRNVKEAVEDPVDTESFFLTDDINDAIDSENEEEEILETAEEKRLRLGALHQSQQNLHRYIKLWRTSSQATNHLP